MKKTAIRKPAAKPATVSAAARRAKIAAAAERGVIPPAPDFSAETHRRFRKRHAELRALVKARDLKGLREFQIAAISTSPKALDRYRRLAITAITAKGSAR